MRVVVSHVGYSKSTRTRLAADVALSWKIQYPEFFVDLYVNRECMDYCKEYLKGTDVNILEYSTQLFNIREEVKNLTYAWPRLAIESIQTEFPFISVDTDGVAYGRFVEFSELDSKIFYGGEYCSDFRDFKLRKNGTLYQTVDIPEDVPIPGGDFCIFWNKKQLQETVDALNELVQTENCDHGVDEIARVLAARRLGMQVLALFPKLGYLHIGYISRVKDI